METNFKEVYFNTYCEMCEHSGNTEDETPCDECLAIPAREYSHKPEYFKEKE